MGGPLAASFLGRGKSEEAPESTWPGRYAWSCPHLASTPGSPSLCCLCRRAVSNSVQVRAPQGHPHAVLRPQPRAGAGEGARAGCAGNGDPSPPSGARGSLRITCLLARDPEGLASESRKLSITDAGLQGSPGRRSRVAGCFRAKSASRVSGRAGQGLARSPRKRRSGTRAPRGAKEPPAPVWKSAKSGLGARGTQSGQRALTLQPRVIQLIRAEVPDRCVTVPRPAKRVLGAARAHCGGAASRDRPQAGLAWPRLDDRPLLLKVRRTKTPHLPRVWLEKSKFLGYEAGLPVLSTP